MSELRTNRIVPRDGLPSGSSGGIIQVKSATKTDTQSISGAGSSADITGLSLSITPTRADSKILVMYSVNTGATEGGYNGAINLFRDSTQIYLGDAAGDRERVSNLISISNTGGGTDYNMVHLSGHHLDSPSTTSATTYKVQIINVGGRTNYINRNHHNGDTAATPRTASSITLMEIAG